MPGIYMLFIIVVLFVYMFGMSLIGQYEKKIATKSAEKKYQFETTLRFRISNNSAGEVRFSEVEIFEEIAAGRARISVSGVRRVPLLIRKDGAIMGEFLEPCVTVHN